MRPVTRSLAPLLASVVLALPLSTVQAQITTFSAFLSGLQEEPPNLSPGTGTVVVTLNEFVNTMRVKVSFTGLIGTTTVAHIHCCTATPVAGTGRCRHHDADLLGVPLGCELGHV